MKTRLTVLGIIVTFLLLASILTLPAQAQGPVLSITKTVTLTNDPAQRGDPLTYTIVVANNGPVSATNVLITDTLPNYVDGADLNTTTTITANDRVTYTIKATLTPNASFSTTITNTAYFSHTSGVGQDSAVLITAQEPQTAPFNILAPTTTNPAFAGPHNNPQKIIVRLTKPEHGLTSDKFTVTVGSAGANIVTRYEGSDQYVLEVASPAQGANGLYDLTVSATTSTGQVSDSEPKAVYYADNNNVDVVLVIDRSGSMTGNKIATAKGAAQQFVDLMNDNDQLGVVSFNQVATVNFSMTTVISGTKTQAKSEIDTLNAGGTTSIGDGLLKGQAELTRTGLVTHPWAIVLLSDGKHNTPPDPQDALPGITSTKTVIHSIAFGADADELLMQELADLTGGTYNKAPGPNELTGVYNTIAGAVTGQQMLTFLRGVVQQGATDEKIVIIDPTVEQATFSIGWANGGSQLDLILEDPNSNVIDPTVAASNADIEYVSGSNYAYYRIVSPTLVAGTWKMKITGGTIAAPSAGVSAAASEEQYTLQVLGKTVGAGLNLHTYIDKINFQPGEPIKVSVTLSDNQPVTGSDVNVLAVVGPLYRASSSVVSSEGPTLFLDLYDDGAHGDGPANDGVYANTLPGSETANKGTYNFSMFAWNNGQTFARESQVTVLVGAQAAPFSLAEDPYSIYLPLVTKE